MPAVKPKSKGKGKRKGKSKPGTPKRQAAGEYPLSADQIAEVRKVFNVFSKGS